MLKRRRLPAAERLLLFLKMDKELTEALGEPSALPVGRHRHPRRRDPDGPERRRQGHDLRGPAERNDFRTNQRFTLRERPLRRADLDEFVAAFRTKSTLHTRQESERFRRFAYADLARRDKLNLDIFWLKDAGATDPDSLPPPAEIAAEIVDSLELALEKFRQVAAKLGPSGT